MGDIFGAMKLDYHFETDSLYIEFLPEPSLASRPSSRHPGVGRDPGCSGGRKLDGDSPPVQQHGQCAVLHGMDPGLRRDDATSCGELKEINLQPKPNQL